MGTVFEFSKKKIFTLAQARELLPLIKRITDEASQLVSHNLGLLEALRTHDQTRTKALEEKINKVVAEWQTKIEKLGAEGKGLWLVDFDCGTGYLCWKHPEDTIDFFHGYTEGFQARKLISDKVLPFPQQPQPTV